MAPGHSTYIEGSPGAAGRLIEEPQILSRYSDVSPISPESCPDESFGRRPQSPNVRAPRKRALSSKLGWWWEVGACLVGIICMCLTVAILFYMSGKPLNAWRLPIQPNSLIAVFSAITKSALLIPIAECISQLMWVYYDKSKAEPLSQLQYFHDASRGPWGSTVLFWKTRMRPPYLALFGAAITVMMLLFEPFAQQVLEFPSQPVAIENSFGSATYAYAMRSTENDTFLNDLLCKRDRA